MASSYFTNIPQWQFANAELGSVLPVAQAELTTPQFLAVHNNPIITNPLLDTNHLETYAHLVPYDQRYPFLQEGFEPYSCLESFQQLQQPDDIGVNCFLDFMSLDVYSLGFSCYEQIPTLECPVLPPAYDNNMDGYNVSVVATGDDQRKRSVQEGSLSPQSIAARQRRRKISEKTQQLAELIPGAHKLNTADMFQAGFKYVKFLQAQLAILQSMDAIWEEDDEAFEVEDLQAILLQSPLVQEKLYTEEKCLVNKQFVRDALLSKHEFMSNASTLESFKSLIQTDCLDAS